jgi:hypothetical protein
MILQEEITPWYERWREMFIETTKFSDHELVEQPIAFYYFLTTTEQDVLVTAQQLINKLGSFKQYKEKIYDSTVPKIFFVLHDLSQSVKADVAAH